MIDTISDLPLGYYCLLYDTAKWFFSIFRVCNCYDADFVSSLKTWGDFKDDTVHYYMYLIYRFQGDIEEMINHIKNDPIAFQIKCSDTWKSRNTIYLNEWMEIYCKIQIYIPVFEEKT